MGVLRSAASSADGAAPPAAAPAPAPAAACGCERAAAAASKRLRGAFEAAGAAAGAGVAARGAAAPAPAGEGVPGGLAAEGTGAGAGSGAVSGMPYARERQYRAHSAAKGQERTVMRYSTARCGLLKLALIARCTWSLGKPMLTISLMLVSSAEPARNDADESPG